MNMANRLNQLVLALAAIACATAPADAAIFGNYKVKGESTGILMGGEIVPGDAAKFEAFINQMPRAPTAVALRKSNGVPLTARNSPVGIKPASTGEKWSALIVIWCDRTSPEPCPARLK